MNKNTFSAYPKFIFVVCFFMLFGTSKSLQAQAIEITPSYGYQFGAKLKYGGNYIKFDDSDQFGVTVGYETYNGLMLELSYLHHGTDLLIKDFYISPIESRLADLSADWILIGGNRYFGNSDVIKPFFGGNLGLVILGTSNENRELTNRSYSETKFAFSFKGGVNFMFNEYIGLNLQANLMMPVEYGGFYVYGGSGGVSTGSEVYSTIALFGFSSGLVFRLD
ncbi:outer membrane beta-barrel protein [Bizionia sp. KMM 8389]